MASLSIVVVTLNEAQFIRACLDALLPQLEPGDELVVVDNGSEDGTPETVAELAPDARILRLAGNPGTTVAPDFAEAIRRPLTEHRGWAAWQALLTQQGGAEVNTSGGIVHYTGISWAGEVGRPSAAISPRPRQVGFASSACLAMPRARWDEVGGFPEEFF